MCAPSLVALARYLQARLWEPYAIFWLEPHFHRAALAFHRGTDLYGPPSLDYTPPIYNPALSVVGGLAFDWLSPGLPVLRVFSVGCFVALGLVVGVWALRQTGRPGWSLLCATLALSPCARVEHFVSVGVDGPFGLFCGLGILLCTVESRRRLALVAAALCIVIAFLFKQTAAPLGPALALYLWTRDRREAIGFALVCGGAAALVVLLLSIASNGWYWTYALTIPLETPRREHVRFLDHMLRASPFLSAAFLICPLPLVLLGPSRLRPLWPILWVTTLAMGYFGLAKVGGDTNTLLPILLCALLMWACIPTLLGSLHAGSRWRLGASVGLSVLAALSVHLFLHYGLAGRVELEYRDGPTYPRRAAFEARLAAFIRSARGPVFVGARVLDLEHVNTHQEALYEGYRNTRIFDLASIMDPLLARHPYASMLVWDLWFDDEFEQRLDRYYERRARFADDPIIGLPVYLWTPRQGAATPDTSRDVLPQSTGAIANGNVAYRIRFLRSQRHATQPGEPF